MRSSSRERSTPPRASARSTARLNSGDLLAKRLGLLNDLSLAEKRRLCSWNFTPRKEYPLIDSHRGLLEMLTIEQLRQLSDIYFAEIHPVYKFLTRDMIDHAIDNLPTEILDEPQECLLYGVAALGCLFNDEDVDIELKIVQKFRISLEYSLTLETPTLDHIAGWMLRVIYLRFTGSPSATWIASCTLMHMMEVINLPADIESRQSDPAKDGPYTLQLKVQLYCTARIFNSWISYDYGKPRLVPQEASYKVPMEGWTSEDRLFWKFTNDLDPDSGILSNELEKMLTEVFELQTSHPSLQLKRCNISLCIYRRLRENKNGISDKAMEQIFSMANDGLETAAEMARSGLPWWHILNVPFQTLCVMLAIDSPSASRQVTVSKTMETLGFIVGQYSADSIEKTWDCVAKLLEINSHRLEERLEEMHRFMVRMYRHAKAGQHSVTDRILEESLEYAENPVGGFFDWDDIFAINMFGL